MMKTFFMRTLLASAALSLGFGIAANAQSEAALNANKARLGLLTATANSTHAAVGADLARILDGKQDLRIVPYLSQGSLANIEDLMTYRHADLALVNADSMLSRRLQNPDDPRNDQMNYIAKLFSLEMHVITRADSGINSLADLNGRRIATGEARSGTFLTSSLLLRASGVRATAISLAEEESLFALLDEEIDAVFLLAGKPSPLLGRITADDNLALVGLNLPENLRQVYSPTEFTSDDYPNLVQDKFVPTMSVDVILASFGTPPSASDEYRVLRSLTEEIQRNSAQLRRPPSHPKWAGFDLAAEVSGWERNAVVAAVLSGEAAEELEQLSLEELMLQTGSDQ